ncbi:hypothetical protein H0H81_009504 [Sphagnurus paluster]|uniref:Pyridoxamine 5'-phosphate oxidase Alr4036 family FMN-binding domain-containing protein n=1 Tax=Sphagnurus paluster TaxID=117069 RepID=A0A9P7GNK6_9AGAR|nr:hypothetical protein H0H81_009504 [Sphagnurus paluster]
MAKNRRIFLAADPIVKVGPIRISQSIDIIDDVTIEFIRDHHEDMAASTVPRWKTAIAKAIAEHEKAVGECPPRPSPSNPKRSLMTPTSQVIQLASIDPSSPIPHVRSHIFREFVTPTSSPGLPLLLTTTDIRTPKTTQIISNPHVQIAWWIEGTQEQFRVSGVASAIPAPTNMLYKHFVHNVKHAKQTSAVAALTREGFDWEAKRMAMFRGMSGHMKASWCRPVPGSRLEGGEEEAKKWPVRLEEPGEHSTDEDRKNWEKALGNFALVIVDPTDVDYVELGVVPNRRTRFWKNGDGVWDEEALVP